jgi:hypothetical protein
MIFSLFVVKVAGWTVTRLTPTDLLSLLSPFRPVGTVEGRQVVYGLYPI